MADLTKWKPWYARIPGAMVGTVGLLGALALIVPTLAFMIPCGICIAMLDIGLEMMERDE